LKVLAGVRSAVRALERATADLERTELRPKDATEIETLGRRIAAIQSRLAPEPALQADAGWSAPVPTVDSERAPISEANE
jgi:hypothetical protein